MKTLIRSLIAGIVLLSASSAFAATAIVTTNLNFRAGPGTQYGLRGTIPAGQPVTIRNCSGNWCQINYGTRTGWVSSNFLAFESGNEVYRSYNQPSSSLNITIGGGYWDDGYNRPWHHRPPPHGNGHRPPPPPPHWGNRPPPPPPPGHRPQRPPHWETLPSRPPHGSNIGRPGNGWQGGGRPPSGNHRPGPGPRPGGGFHGER